MSDIYDQHKAAFARVSAYVVLKDGGRVATVAFKFPADGAGRLWAYVHWFGTEMVRGHAGGYGYDKRSAAVAVGAQKMRLDDGTTISEEVRNRAAFRSALSKDDGEYWDRRLESAGFTVLQAV